MSVTSLNLHLHCKHGRKKRFPSIARFSMSCFVVVFLYPSASSTCLHSSDADFPAIYDDLFGKRTFDAANGGWSFKSYASYTLPEFL